MDEKKNHQFVKRHCIRHRGFQPGQGQNHFQSPENNGEQIGQ